MNTKVSDDNRLVFTYLEHRKTIGILGIALPFVVALGALIIFHTDLQSSISSYYYTGMRDVFVGILFVIGFFLLSYKGYDLADNIAGDLACLFSVGVAIFPTFSGETTGGGTQFTGYAHYACAALFFVTLAFFSLILFTKTHPDKPPSKRKQYRNRVYKTCGYTMISCLLLMIILSIIPEDRTDILERYHPVFWLEALAIMAFGVSWFTKGGAILQDRETNIIISKK